MLRYSGLPFLVREFIQSDKVTILVLHDIEPEKAYPMFSWLAKNYNIIDLNTYFEAHRRKDPGLLPKKPLVITLDDGHVSNYKLLPILQELNIPATIFLCAGIINTNRHFWFKFKRSNIPTQKLKRLPTWKKREILQEAGFHHEKEYASPQALNQQQIEAMKGWVNFQAHTVFHPCLPKCRTQRAKTEIEECKNILEKDYGLVINSIAYPNGDYSDRDIELVRNSGYEFGLTVDFGLNTVETPPFRIKRLSVDDNDSVDTVSLKASGIWAFIKTRNGKKQAHGWTANVTEDAKPRTPVHLLIQTLLVSGWNFSEELICNFIL